LNGGWLRSDGGGIGQGEDAGGPIIDDIEGGEAEDDEEGIVEGDADAFGD